MNRSITMKFNDPALKNICPMFLPPFFSLILVLSFVVVLFSKSFCELEVLPQCRARTTAKQPRTSCTDVDLHLHHDHSMNHRCIHCEVNLIDHPTFRHLVTESNITAHTVNSARRHPGALPCPPSIPECVDSAHRSPVDSTSCVRADKRGVRFRPVASL